MKEKWKESEPNQTSVVTEPKQNLNLAPSNSELDSGGEQWTGKHDLCKTNAELWSKVDITWFQYIFLFNKAKHTFSSVVYAILQCKKTDIFEPNQTDPGSHRTQSPNRFQILDKNPNRTLVVLEPKQNWTRAIKILSHLYFFDDIIEGKMMGKATRHEMDEIIAWYIERGNLWTVKRLNLGQINMGTKQQVRNRVKNWQKPAENRRIKKKKNGDDQLNTTVAYVAGP